MEKALINRAWALLIGHGPTLWNWWDLASSLVAHVPSPISGGSTLVEGRVAGPPPSLGPKSGQPPQDWSPT